MGSAPGGSLPLWVVWTVQNTEIVSSTCSWLEAFSSSLQSLSWSLLTSTSHDLVLSMMQLIKSWGKGLARFLWAHTLCQALHNVLLGTWFDEHPVWEALTVSPVGIQFAVEGWSERGKQKKSMADSQKGWSRAALRNRCTFVGLGWARMRSRKGLKFGVRKTLDMRKEQRKARPGFKMDFPPYMVA